MQFQGGGTVSVGDRVEVDGTPGVVVFSLATRSYSAAYPREEWGHYETGELAGGVGVLTQAYGLLLVTEGTSLAVSARDAPSTSSRPDAVDQ